MITATLNSAILREFATLSVVKAAQMLVPDQVADEPDPGPRATPRAMRQWLAGLRLLEAVPFSHLVPHAALLPTESIRFFVVDRNWTDALVEGALSIGTITSADAAGLEALYPTVRREVDEEERLVRLPGWEPGAPVPSGPAGTLSGFLLRSAVVSGWPALHVRGYGRDPAADGLNDNADPDDTKYQRLITLRMERLAPAVLLVIFDGVPEVVHLEEPRAGVQFGVVLAPGGDSQQAFVPPRDATTGELLPRAADDPGVPVPFRSDGPGVIHLARLDAALRARNGTNLGPTVDSAEFALEMLRFPFRCVFGDAVHQDPEARFVPRVSTEVLRGAYQRVLHP